MLHKNLPADIKPNPRDFLFSVLEETEVGLVVVSPEGQPVYMNSSARSIFQSDAGELPAWTDQHLAPMLDRVYNTGGQVVERWSHSEIVLRVRARPLESRGSLAVLEITVAHASGSRQVAELLSRSLQLSISDARLLALLWRGMSNDEIAETLRVRVGTVKSRLFRLYQRLGVKRRPAAVLRAAEVIGRAS